jgi:hypothetical protein
VGSGIAGAGSDPDLPPVTVGVGIGSDEVSPGTGCPREMEVGEGGLEGEMSWAGLFVSVRRACNLPDRAVLELFVCLV